ncbi:MAG: tetratricopeptide repeat protein [Bacteroidetes bacterium]|nr:tetratricopeptide repeat protein [Bacteroidota bacterium]
MTTRKLFLLLGTCAYTCLFVLLFCVNNVFAQKFLVQSAANYLDYDELDKAKTAIDKAHLHDKTNNDPKMWYYRGQVYFAIHYDTTGFDKLSDDAIAIAAKSFVNCIATDKNLRHIDIAKDMMSRSGVGCYNAGIEAYMAGEYEKAIHNYMAIFDIFPVEIEHDMDAKLLLKRRNITRAGLYYNSYLASSKMDDDKRSKDYLEKLIEMNYNEPLIYIYMGRMYMKEGDTTKALEYVEMGRDYFEEDPDLITEELNIYIMQGNVEILIVKLTEAIELDPENKLLYFNRVTLYENRGETDKAEADYMAAIELDEKYFYANYNLGALYYNQAVELIQKLDDINFLKQKSLYEKIEGQADGLFKKSIPSLENALEIKPKDRNTLIALKEIYARTGDLANSTDMRRRLQELEEDDSE